MCGKRVDNELGTKGMDKIDHFAYAAEKFSTARRNLMLPHPKGEAQSIMHAFHECSLGLDDIDKSKLDENAATRVRKLEQLMDTSGLEDPDEEGLWVVKARQLTIDEKIELSGLIDELAHWFDRQE